MPWDAKPDDPGGHLGASEPSNPDATPAADGLVTPDATPTEIVPTPDAAPPLDGALLEPPPIPDQPTPVEPPPPAAGLISAAPVGWGAPPSATSGATPSPGDPGATGAPAVGWATQPSHREVPGAPGLVFADTPSRFVAWILDGIISSILAYLVLVLFAVGLVAVNGTRTSTTTDFVLTVAFVLVNLAYFVFFWTGGRRSTPGQRLFKIQVGNAFDGRGLTVEQAIRRWLGYGEFLALFVVVASAATVVSLAILIWEIVLLVTTIGSPTKQGLHDRFANTALVRPAGAGSGGLVIGCLLIIGLLVILPIIVLGVLVRLYGDQIKEILSEIGNSI